MQTTNRLSVASLTTQDKDQQPDFAFAFFNNAINVNNTYNNNFTHTENCEIVYEDYSLHPPKRKKVGSGNICSDSLATVTSPLASCHTPAAACTLHGCCVCAKGVPACFGFPPTWADVCFLAMYALAEAHPGQTSFHIRKDVCAFIDAHFELICQKSKTAAWRQTVNMTLSHPQYSDMFVQEVSIEKGRKGNELVYNFVLKFRRILWTQAYIQSI
jgi:hypothetical protein